MDAAVVIGIEAAKALLVIIGGFTVAVTVAGVWLVASR